MSLRLASRAARCELHRAWPPRRQLIYQQCNGSAQSFQPFCQRRGAKTKSTLKLSKLPQGALPPLPQEDVVPPPEKTYPTVLQQHLNNTRKFKDCIVLTRVGDFYEMYFEQVDQYAPLVNLKRAKRSTVLGDVPMAGFQHTQLERYLKMFVQDLGKQVAISEQVRLPEGERGGKSGGMLWDRKVTRVVTAGTLIDESFMDPFENNFLLAIHFAGALPAVPAVGDDRAAYERYRRSAKVGLSWGDLSSGDFFTQSSDLATLPSLVARIGPREVVLDSTLASADQTQLQRLISDAAPSLHFHEQQHAADSVAEWASMLERPVSSEEQDEFTAVEVSAGNLILDYIREKMQGTTVQLQPPVRRSDDESMAIDKQSLRNLEIRSTLRDGTFQGSLLHAIRQTVTKSGARLLSQRLVSPSMSLSIINNRLDLAQEMLRHDVLREEVLGMLRRTFDTYRLLQKFSIGKGDADDLLGLARTIDVMRQVSSILHEHIIANQDNDPGEAESDFDLTFLWDILGRFDLETPAKVARNIQVAIDEEGLNQQHMVEEANESEAEQMTEEVVNADAAGERGPKLSRRTSRAQVSQSSDKPGDPKSDDIWIMCRNASQTLERAHRDLEKLLDAKFELARRLRSELQADSLTLKWSAQLGHFCHVKGKDAQSTLSSLSGARTIGSTKSTRSFYLSDWTHLGVRIDDAKLRIRTEEERVFGKLRGEVLENLMKLRRNAAVLDELDVACSSAVVAKQRNLVRPILNNSSSHRLLGGRHPTVDAGLNDQGRNFVSNNCTVGDEGKIYLITGPNMAGKSTYLRQNALITILAQTGCFVPADYAEIGLVDKIFSRVGSADNLYQDQSTFMVEMLETADILKEATPRSFVIMDEVGRGTTPEDGIAVGYACLHHLQNVNQCRALFATHFHALADMTQDFEDLVCYCTDVLEEQDGSWSYVHKLRRGVNRDSHALKVAQLAGLPESAIAVAADVLADIQGGRALRQPNSTVYDRGMEASG
ncbi:related to mismatch repair ATPase (family) [Lecanosticta acicola]|uniref:Related to mismatch repair ATPase ( family) n=1 Tax=Lecanosticta acicola TaxID=111012 RepID=A0AAI8Z777_9PEZI|nr:related to mismatch repair ATPase (family) [Lecanosticta acicola]